MYRLEEQRLYDLTNVLRSWRAVLMQSHNSTTSELIGDWAHGASQALECVSWHGMAGSFRTLQEEAQTKAVKERRGGGR